MSLKELKYDFYINYDNYKIKRAEHMTARTFMNHINLENIHNYWFPHEGLKEFIDKHYNLKFENDISDDDHTIKYSRTQITKDISLTDGNYDETLYEHFLDMLSTIYYEMESVSDALSSSDLDGVYEVETLIKSFCKAYGEDTPEQLNYNFTVNVDDNDQLYDCDDYMTKEKSLVLVTGLFNQKKFISVDQTY